MSWAEVKNLKDKMSELSDATLRIKVGTPFAGKTIMLKRYNKDYMNVTLDSQGEAEVSVQPKSRYEIVDQSASNNITSGVFYVGAGEFKEVEFSMYTEDGDKALPVDDVRMLLACAGVAHVYNYTTIESVIADAGCVEAIVSNLNGFKYLLRSEVLLNKIIYNDSFLNLVGQHPKARYAAAMNDTFCSKLCADETYWAKATRVFNQAPAKLPSSANVNASTVYDNGDAIWTRQNPNYTNDSGMTNAGMYDGATVGQGYNGSGSHSLTLRAEFKGNRKFIPKLFRAYYGPVTASYIVASTNVNITSGSAEPIVVTKSASPAGTNTPNRWYYGNCSTNKGAVSVLNIVNSGNTHGNTSYNYNSVNEVDVFGVWEDDKE